jgi:Protein of unknown function (DUF2510)
VIDARAHPAFGGLFFILALAAIVLFIFVLVDVVRRPAWQWQQARSNKALWIVLEVALLVLVAPASIISGIIYLATVRPKLMAVERSGQGPGGQGGWGSYQGPGGYPSPGAGYYGAPPEPHGTPGSYGPWGTPGSYGAPDSGDTASTREEPSSGPPRYPGTEGPGQWSETPGQVPPSWQPDPTHRHELRYWDGNTWTEHVSDRGQQSTDPPVP